MKKLIAIILTAIILTATATACAYEDRFTMNADNLYPNTAIVVVVDGYEDLVTCIDAGGREWTFYGAEDWMPGDLVSLLMFDNFTEYVMDDVIMVAYYGGYAGLELAFRWADN